MKLTFKKLCMAVSVMAVTLAGLTSCNSENNNEPQRQALMAFMTYDSSSLGLTTFTYQARCGAPYATLSSSQQIPTDRLTPGARVLSVFYAPGDTLPTRNATIELLQLGEVLTVKPQTCTSQDIPDWNEIPTYLMTLSLTDDYLDMISQVQSEDLSKQKFAMYIDQESLSSDCAQVYIANTAFPSYGAITSQFFTSFDITTIKASGVKKMRVHINNSNVVSHSFITFDLTTGAISY